MAGFNKVILMGNLTRDPELRYTPQGTAVADLRLAVTTMRGGRDTERKEETLFVDVTVWQRQAETACEYLSKGRPVLVEGRLVMDQWEDRETGAKRSKIKVVASTVQFLGGRGGDHGGDNKGSPGERQQAPAAAEPAKSQAPLEEDFGGSDDIPF